MSTGKKFAKSEPTPEDRIEAMENKIAAMAERIKAYDSVLEENALIRKKLEAVSAQYNSLAEASSQSIASVRVLASSAFDRHSEHVRRFEALDKTLAFYDQEKRELIDYVIKLEEVNKKAHQQVDAKLQKVVSPLAKAADLAQVASQFNSRVDEAKSAVSSLNDKLLKMAEDVLGLLHSQRESDETDKFFHHNIDALSCSIKEARDDFNKRIVDHEKKVENTWQSVKDSLQVNLKELKTELVGMPSSLASTRAEIMNKLEMASLDGANATLLAKNHSEQIKIIEKKIEGLNAKIQTLQLNR